MLLFLLNKTPKNKNIMNVLVSIAKKEKYQDEMIKSSLSFLSPMKQFKDIKDRIVFKLYDLKDLSELDHKLNILAEASSMDFSYRFQILKD